MIKILLKVFLPRDKHASQGYIFIPDKHGAEASFAGSPVRSTTHHVYRVVTPSAACSLNRRLCPQEGYKRECRDCTRHVGLEILDSQGTGGCC